MCIVDYRKLSWFPMNTKSSFVDRLRGNFDILVIIFILYMFFDAALIGYVSGCHYHMILEFYLANTKHFV